MVDGVGNAKKAESDLDRLLGDLDRLIEHQASKKRKRDEDDANRLEAKWRAAQELSQNRRRERDRCEWAAYYRSLGAQHQRLAEENLAKATALEVRAAALEAKATALETEVETAAPAEERDKNG